MAKNAYILLIVLLIALLLTLAITVAAADDDAVDAARVPSSSLTPAAESNLLTNPSFEGKYQPYVPPDTHPDCPFNICDTAKMADGWSPWWIKSRPTDVNPEYKAAESIFTDPVRVRPDGEKAQQYFSFQSTHEAGIYQEVNVQSGTNYCFSIWGHSWSANDDEDAYSGPEHGWLDQKIGIDPTGGKDPLSAEIVWGPPRVQYDEYGSFTIGATALADQVTVFTYSRPIWSAKHNDVYWDDAELESVEVSGELVVTPTMGLDFETNLWFPKTMTKVLTITYPLEPCLTTFMASVETSSNLTATIRSNHNYSGAQLTVELDSIGLPPGTHLAAINIKTNLSVAGSPLHIPIKLSVINDKETTYIPAIIGN